MHEHATVRDLPATTTLKFADVTLPPHWQPELSDTNRTVAVTDVDGDEYQLAVHPAVVDALRRACLLAPANLCTRIDLGYRDTPECGLQVVTVYWEA